MDISVKIAITAPDGVVHEHEIAAFEKGCESAAEIGLSIGDSKELLLNLQREIVAAQAAAFCSARSTCPCCAGKLRHKGNKPVQYRTVFGDIPIDSPRFYHCHCHAGSAQTFSPLTMLLPRPYRARNALAGNQMGIFGLIRRHSGFAQRCAANRRATER